jgi:enamine deaminase RidA (YjgF/YER057c/UK114 family)
MQMAKKLVNPERLYDGSPFGMSQAVIDTETSLVFVSGQVAWDHQYQVSQSSVSGQFKAALENLRTVLTAAGSSIDSLLHVRIYVRGELEEHMESLAPILASFLGSSRPAVTGIGVASLASKATLVEVEAVAKAESFVSPRVAVQ